MPSLVSVQLQDIYSYSVTQYNSRQSTYFYLVTFDGPAQPTDAEGASGIPGPGDADANDTSRKFKQKRPQCVENSNRTQWQVQVDYDSSIPSEANPLDLPAAIAWDYSDGTETYSPDHASLYSGIVEPSGAAVTADQPCTNSAGAPWDRPPERESGTWSATWTKNVATSVSIASEISVMQGVNVASFTFDGQTIAQYAAKISGGSLSAVQISNGFSYRVLVYKLKFKSGGWIDRIEDRGTLKLSSGIPVPVVIGGAGSGLPGQATNRTFPLDGAGGPKASSTDTGEELDFYPYKPIDFSVFGFS